MNRWLIFTLSLFLLGNLNAQEEAWEYPLGPVGATFRTHSAAPYARVSAVEAGSPGQLAGLQVDDYLYGSKGEVFGFTNRDERSLFTGVIQGLGEAIERAYRFKNGFLELDVLRPNVGLVTLNISLPTSDGLGAAFPLGSTSTSQQYEASCQALYEIYANGGGNYSTAFGGLVLLSHPNFNDTTGDKPYRVAIDKIRDYYLGRIAEMEYAPVEAFLYDGSANPNHTLSSELENWYLGPGLLFLTEYSVKTGDTSFTPSLQTVSEMVGNRIQWWRQPQSKFLAPGMTAHGGVKGDYGGHGMNVTGSEMFAALAAAKKSGLVDMTVRPRDGRYFGYADGATLPAGMTPYDDEGLELNIVPAGWETQDPTLDDKLAFKWQHFKETTSDKGRVSYAYGYGNGDASDGGGRTAGALTGYLVGGAPPTPTAEDVTTAALMTDALARFHPVNLNNHAHCTTGFVYTQMAAPSMTSRQRRFIFENWKFWYHLGRKFDGTREYMYSRRFEDSDGQRGTLKEVYSALPYAVAKGGLSFVPAYDTSDWIVDFKETKSRWETFEYRELHIDASSYNFDLALIDGAGNTVNSTDYTVAWTVENGPAGAEIFTDSTALDAELTFSEGGIYDVTLTVTAADSSQVVSEPIRLYVSNQTVPTDWTRGEVQQVAYVRSGTIAALKSDRERYLTEPTAIQTLNALEFDDRFLGKAAVVNGYITAPTTGDYTFYVAGNTEVEFWIDLNDGNGLQKIAYSSDTTEKREWEKTVEQASAAISLTAGEWYQIQVFHAGAYGDHYFAAGWKKPGETEIEVIGADVLARPATDSGATVLAQPASTSTTLGNSFNLHFDVLDSGPGLYQWRRNGTPVGTASHFPYFSMYNVGGAQEAEFDCVYTGPGGVVTSSTAQIDLTDTGELKMGGLWKEVYYNIRWRQLSDLFADEDYPYFPGASFVTQGGKDTVTWNDIGQRSTGWLIPAESGRYRFHLASNDDGRLYLSPNEYSISKKQIVEIADSGSGGPDLMEWSEGVVSDWVDLEAGKRYYIEVLHKAARTDGAAHFGVAMQKEGDADPVDFEGAIPGELLQYRRGGYHDDTADEPELINDDRIKVQPATTHSLDLIANDDIKQDYTVTSIGSSSYGTLTLLADLRTVEFTWNGTDFNEEDIAVTVLGADGATGNSTLTLSGVDREDFGQDVVGGLWQEIYTGIDGKHISDLFDAPTYLDFGNVSQSIDGPDFVYDDEEYGQVISGWIIPEESGTYEFLMTADERANVYLSYDNLVAHQRLILESESRIYSYREWSDSLHSGAVELVAGQEYYIEIHHKQDNQDDYFALNWRKVGESLPADGSTMTGATFKYRVGGIDEFTLFTAPHAADDYLAVVPGLASQIDVLANDGSDQDLTLLSVESALYGSVSIAADGRSVVYEPYLDTPRAESFGYTVTTAFGMSATGTVRVQPYGSSTPYVIQQGGLWQEVFESVSGGNVSDLTGTVAFPLSPSSYGVVSSPELSEIGDAYGQRLSGWISPDTSGDYEFYLSANDQAELWLSTTEEEAQKVKLITHSEQGATPKSWSTASLSASVSLVAGEHYFIEILHKEDSSDDHVALNWRKVGEAAPADGASITGATFSYSIGQNLITPSAAGVLIAKDDEVGLWGNGSVSIDLTYNDLSLGSFTSVTLNESLTAANYTLTGTTLTLNQEGVMPVSETISYTVNDGQGLSQTANLTIYYYDFNRDLEAFYPMDHMVDGYVLDHSGNGRHAQVKGDMSLNTDAMRDRALDVNRGSAGLGYLEADMSASPIVLDEHLSLAFWAKGDASFYPNNYTAVDCVSNEGERVFAAQSPWKNGEIYWDAGNESGWDRMDIEDSDLETLGDWHHWVFIKDATTQVMDIYVDGQLWATESGHARKFTGNIPLLRIGVNRNLGNSYHGLLDDVRVYSRVLSSKEISLLYQYGHLDQLGGTLADYSTAIDGNGDLNDDGQIDLVDVAFGSDPASPDLSKYPQMTLHNGLPSFKYRRITGGAALGDHVYEWNGLLYCIESSNSLESGSWSCDSTLYEQVGFEADDGSGTEAIYLRPSAAQSSSEKLFFRLKLTQP